MDLNPILSRVLCMNDFFYINKRNILLQNFIINRRRVCFYFKNGIEGELLSVGHHVNA